jgi:hypothetical protein
MDWCTVPSCSIIGRNSFLGTTTLMGIHPRDIVICLPAIAIPSGIVLCIGGQYSMVG